MQHATPSRLLGATLALLAFGLAESASAAIVPQGAPSGGEDITFDWSGRCNDCTGSMSDGEYEDVTGSLSLRNFVADEAISFDNFASFTYDGSSLIDGFTITPDDLSSPTVYGAFKADGTLTENFQVGFFVVNGFGGFAFTTGTDGRWSLGSFDVGIDSSFTLAEAPVPATLFLLPFGLAALRLTRRR